jgi:hypothetical protein
MPDHPPIASSAPREPNRRPQPIPAKVRAAVRAMVWGADDDPDAKPLNLVDAAKAAGIAGYVLRRYLDRPGVIAFLRSERRVFREAICAGNEGALRTIRDGAANTMSRVAAIRQLEQMEAEEDARPTGNPAGLTIRIVAAGAPEPPPVVDVTPEPAATLTHYPNRCSVLDSPASVQPRRYDEKGNPIFDPFRHR